MQTKIKLIITKQVEHVVLDFTRQITVSKKRNSLAFAIFYAGCLHYPPAESLHYLGGGVWVSQGSQGLRCLLLLPPWQSGPG